MYFSYLGHTDYLDHGSQDEGKFNKKLILLYSE